MVCKFWTVITHWLQICFFHVKQNFGWNWQDLVTNQSGALVLIALLNLANIHQSLSKTEAQEQSSTNNHVQNWILCKAADPNQQPVLEKGVCSDSSQTAQLFQMVVHKSLETISWLTLNWWQGNQTLQSNRSKMQSYLCQDCHTCIDCTGFDLDSKTFWAACLWK